MRKLSILAAVAALSTSFTTSAYESGFYLGLNLGFGGGTEVADFSDEEVEGDYDFTSTKVAFGYIADDRIRFEGSFSTYKLDFDDFDGEDKISSFDIDGYLTLGSDQVRPYFMGGFGLATYQDTADFTEEDEDLSGVSFQVGAGVVFPINDSVELDASYRIRVIAWQAIEVSNGFYSEDLNLSNTFSEFGIGAKYVF